MWRSPARSCAGWRVGARRRRRASSALPQQARRGRPASAPAREAPSLSRPGARVRRVRARARPTAGVSETLERLAVVEDGLVNWPPIEGMRLDENGDGQIAARSGATARPDRRDARSHAHEGLAVAGGELTWRARPARQGREPCHGTAGNGYAFLALLERTGDDERWLTRACAVRRACRAPGGAQPVGAWPRPLHALDGRSRHGSSSWPTASTAAGSCRCRKEDMSERDGTVRRPCVCSSPAARSSTPAV